MTTFNYIQVNVLVDIFLKKSEPMKLMKFIL